MDKRRIKQWLNRVRALKTWQLIIILLLGVLVSATFLRLNNLGMVERRTAVIAADETGNPEELRQSIVDLQGYVSRHMNTNLENGFFLSKTYERDRDAAFAVAGEATNPNSSVYQQASVECRSRFQGGRESFRNDYVQCVIDQVSALGAQSDAELALKLPKADVYKINFSAPLWTPDLAGLAVAFCTVVTLVILGRLALVVALRWLLRRHYQSL